MSNQRYIGEKEVAQILNVALPTLRNWRSQKKGPPYCKLSRSVRYPERDVIAYAESKKINLNG